MQKLWRADGVREEVKYKNKRGGENTVGGRGRKRMAVL